MSAGSRLRIWENPAAEEIGDTPEAFLALLGGPACLYIQGRDSSRTRAVATLLHGNEPSGLRALYRLLRSGLRPEKNMVCFIGAVEAALTPPRFSHRSLPGRRDLNRCFRPPFEGAEGLVAEEMLNIMREVRPEALVDIHNTSGSGPSFGVTAVLDPAHRALTSLFAQRLMVTRIRMGSLMELGETDFPAVTIECGGSLDSASYGVALEGLERFMTVESLFDSEERYAALEVLENPVRVELRDDGQIAYAASAVPGVDLTLRQDIEHFNLRPLSAGEYFGWLGSRGISVLEIKDPIGKINLEDIFQVKDGRLLAAAPLQISMATTVSIIARSDCLFYAFLRE